MKKFFLSVLIILAASAGLAISASAQELKAFKLTNGMSVFIWEDPTMTDVYGEVAVKAGAFDDPSEYTGLAHYLEHMMFKGTTTIGALDWEKERPIYEQIVAKYDEMADASTPEQKKAISQEINKLSIEEVGYTALNEFSNLIEGIGGSSLNAGTSYDYTVYYNRFPANEMNKWLRLAYERFVNPVFRAFQSELETVYEEYNMYQDDRSSRSSQFMLEKLFEGTPYSRDVIGLGEHLKNPRLSKLIEFYDTWYVPENMALILIGNISAKALMVPIKATFGRLPAKGAPEKTVYPDTAISGKKQFTCKMADSPSVIMAFNGPVTGSDDEVATELCLEILSNNYGTGILDKMTRDGDFMGASASSASFGNQGRIIMAAAPYYDQNQRTYESSKKVVKSLTAAAEKIAAGDFDENLVEAIKLCVCRDFDLQMESDQFKAGLIRTSFIYGVGFDRLINYKDIVMGTSTDDIKAAARKYFCDDVTVIFNEIGKIPESEKISKPGFDPVQPPKDKQSQYAEQFQAIPAPPIPEKYLDWDSVVEKQINTYSKLFYHKAEKNDVFTLTLKYGANSKQIPFLKYGASLMNSAGIMAFCKSDELKEEFSKMGATFSISADNEYMYVNLRGYEMYLRETCTLLTRLLLMPELDDKRLGNVIGMAANQRMIRKDDIDFLSQAVREYIQYGENSVYLKEPTDMEILGMDMSKLSTGVHDATQYAAEIHYSGNLTIDEAYPILTTSLPLMEGERPSTSPVIRDMKEYGENTVFFLPNTDCKQAQILFYIPVGKYDKSSQVQASAFSRYIGGGFNGLIMQEIREYNSMAYSASGSMTSRALPGSGQYFSGYIGTQNDKAIDAIRLYLSLLKEMPQHPQYLDGIKSYLLQSALTKQPDDRDLSEFIADAKRKGYTEDPAIEAVPIIKALTWDDVMSYYESRVKGRPIIIGIVGNPKNINAKALSEFGKVIRLTSGDLVNSNDRVF